MAQRDTLGCAGRAGREQDERGRVRRREGEALVTGGQTGKLRRVKHSPRLRLRGGLLDTRLGAALFHRNGHAARELYTVQQHEKIHILCAAQQHPRPCGQAAPLKLRRHTADTGAVFAVAKRAVPIGETKSAGAQGGVLEDDIQNGIHVFRFLFC